jgi:hypothetical protein
MQKQTYVINYNDNSHMVLELNHEMSSLLLSEMVKESSVAFLPGIGTLRLTDVRSIILQLPTEAPTEAPSFTPDLSDKEEEYIRHRQWLEDYYKANPDEVNESDYDGGMMPK